MVEYITEGIPWNPLDYDRCSKTDGLSCNGIVESIYVQSTMVTYRVGYRIYSNKKQSTCLQLKITDATSLLFQIVFEIVL